MQNKSPNRINSDSRHLLKVLNFLKINPHMTQREMNRKMGVSLGKVNYCLSKLTGKGMIKVERFKKATNRAGYAYRHSQFSILNGTLLTSDLKDLNIPRIYLSKLVDAGKLERVSRGVYVTPGTIEDEMYYMQCKYPKT